MTTQTQYQGKMNRRIAFGVLGSGLALLVGCGPKVTNKEKYSFDDYLTNYDGYSIFNTNKGTKEQTEIRFRTYCNGEESNIRVFKDLNGSQERYAEVKTYSYLLRIIKEIAIHLRETDKVQGGDDCTGGKFPVHYRRKIK